MCLCVFFLWISEQKAITSLHKVIPDRLKYSEVKPLFKKGDKTEMSYYRPISLLPSFSKIIEEIIYKRLYCYLKDNNILVNEQFGFRERSTTEMATYALLNNILLSLDKKNLLVGYFVICRRPLIVLTMVYFWRR